MPFPLRHPFALKSYGLGPPWQLETENFVNEFNLPDRLIDSQRRDIGENVQETEQPFKGAPVFGRAARREEMMIKVVQKKSLPLNRKHLPADLGMLDHHQENHHPVVKIGPKKFLQPVSGQGLNVNFSLMLHISNLPVLTRKGKRLPLNFFK